MILATDLLRRLWWLPLLAVYTVIVIWLTLRVAVPTVDAGGKSELADRLQEAHEEEIARLTELQDKELAEREKILADYQQQLETARSDYWATIGQIETQIRAQRSDIIKRIYEDPDAAAQLLSDKYGLIYVP
jgi:hypothetical protein